MSQLFRRRQLGTRLAACQDPAQRIRFDGFHEVMVEPGFAEAVPVAQIIDSRADIDYI